MDTREIISIAVGVAILAYVGYCLVSQKVWVRGEIGLKSTVFAWGAREDNQFVFMLHTIIGTVLGIYMVASPFLW
jgi:hypothetical protein|tara:strand:- start:2608 stop:2832 length:225 start_codon:yes stop_codon:yes gene_type:complete